MKRTWDYKALERYKTSISTFSVFFCITTQKSNMFPMRRISGKKLEVLRQ